MSPERMETDKLLGLTCRKHIVYGLGSNFRSGRWLYNKHDQCIEQYGPNIYMTQQIMPTRCGLRKLENIKCKILSELHGEGQKCLVSPLVYQ